MGGQTADHGAARCHQRSGEHIQSNTKRRSECDRVGEAMAEEEFIGWAVDFGDFGRARPQLPVAHLERRRECLIPLLAAIP